MDNLSFVDIFWPVLVALLSSTIILEVISFGVRYRQFKKQEKLYREMEAKIASGEIPPGALGPMVPDLGSMGFPMGYPPGNHPPTASGKHDHGQYL